MSSAEEAFNNNLEEGADGLTRKQTYKALCECNKDPKGSEIASYFEEDPAGTITSDQFKELHDSIEESTVEGLAEAFQKFDKNGDGTIDKEELKNILRAVTDTTDIETDLSDETVDGIWNAVDTDESGCLSYTELAEYVITNGRLISE